MLKALEPRSQILADRDTLDKAGVGDTILETALYHMRTFQHDFSGMCKGAAALPVTWAMNPIREHIDIRMPAGEVVHRMVAWQTLSILVTDNNRPVGLVRLSDLCDAVIAEMCRTVPEKVAEE